MPIVTISFPSVNDGHCHDLHKDNWLKTEDQRVMGAHFDEILYAEDTIIFGTKTRALNIFLAELEKEAEE